MTILRNAERLFSPPPPNGGCPPNPTPSGRLRRWSFGRRQATQDKNGYLGSEEQASKPCAQSRGSPCLPDAKSNVRPFSHALHHRFAHARRARFDHASRPRFDYAPRHRFAHALCTRFALALRARFAHAPRTRFALARRARFDHASRPRFTRYGYRQDGVCQQTGGAIAARNALVRPKPNCLHSPS